MEDITVPTTKRIYKPIINLVKRDFSVENCETPLASCHWNKKRKLERCNHASGFNLDDKSSIHRQFPVVTLLSILGYLARRRKRREYLSPSPYLLSNGNEM